MAKLATVTTVEKHSNLKRWQPGQSGNPKGRPLGSRHALSEAFLADMLTAWRKNGRKALGRLATENPKAYLRLMFDICSPVWEAEDRQAAEAPRPAFDLPGLLTRIAAGGTGRLEPPPSAFDPVAFVEGSFAAKPDTGA